MGKLRPRECAAGWGSKESEQLCWTLQDLLSFPQHPGEGETAASISQWGNRGTEGLGPLPEGSVLCLQDPCLEPDASGASLGRTSCLCTDQPRWALTRASPGAHAGIRWSSRRHPLELCSNAFCAFLWRHHGLGLACGCTPLHSAACLVEGDRGGPDLAGQPLRLCHGLEATPGRLAPWTPTWASISSPEPG